VFGATIQLFSTILARFGVETTYVSPTRPEEWEKAVKRNTRLFFLETPSNPLTEVSDIAALSGIAKRAGALLAVDNVFCTPALQRPLELGADMVIHSATKYLDGQGRVIGGAIAGPKAVVADAMIPFLRTAGPSISPFNAWVFLKGLETLELRMNAQSAAALAMARWLESHKSVARVFYPGLESHPQHALAKRQQRAAGAVLSFEVKGGRAAAWRVIDSARLVSITANLGDVKTTLIHPATTTHGRISQEARDAAGIGDGLLRIAVGLEAVSDLQEDLTRGLA
jgi:O-succinylhomoserine sulfhydrylase